MPLLDAPLYWLDEVEVLGAAEIQQPAPLSRHFTGPQRASLERPQPTPRPLTTLSLRLEQRLTGGNPVIGHLSNLLLHLGVCALLFAALRRQLADHALGTFYATGLATAWAVLPQLTETVALVSARSESFAALLGLSAWLLWRPSRPRRALAAAFASLSLLTGPAGWVVLAANYVASLSRSRPGTRKAGYRRLLEPEQLSLVAAASWWVVTHARSPQALVPITERAARLLEALARSAESLLSPMRLTALQSGLEPPDSRLVRLGGVMLAGAALALLLGYLARRCKPQRAPLGAPLLLAAPLLLLLLRLVVEGGYAERCLYLPSLALTLLLARAVPTERVRWVLAAALVLCGVATSRRVRLWTAPEAFWNALAVESPPGTALPHLQLARLETRAGYFERAESHVRAILKRTPAQREALSGLAQTLALRGQFTQAEATQQRRVALTPTLAHPRLVLAELQLRAGQLADCKRQLELLRVQSGDKLAVQRLRQRLSVSEKLSTVEHPEQLEAASRARFYELIGNRPAAEIAWLEALEHQPSDAVLGFAGLFFATQGSAKAVSELYRRFGCAPQRAEQQRLCYQLSERAALGRTLRRVMP